MTIVEKLVYLIKENVITIDNVAEQYKEDVIKALSPVTEKPQEIPIEQPKLEQPVEDTEILK